MRGWVLALIWLAMPVQAQEADKAAIDAVIDDQFGDFGRGDTLGAYDHASPFIQSMFGTAENFGLMVRSKYPMIWASKDVRYLDLEEEAGRLVQRVYVADAAGSVYFFDYEMIRVDGQWRINGVYPVAADQVGV